MYAGSVVKLDYTNGYLPATATGGFDETHHADNRSTQWFPCAGADLSDDTCVSWWRAPSASKFSLEKAVSARSRRLAAFIQPGARVKLDTATRAVFNRLASGADNIDPSVLTQHELRSRFGRLSREQSDLLSYYVLAGVARLLSHPEQWQENLDGMNEMSEMTSLRLQMTMDRRSKFISTLSNIMQKIATTQDTLVQNIK